uniref:Uncharacterized protein n=1 Tax=Hordeum vulgare subsp. vulgare TaxID=112509 RepID=A0A8I6YIN8_HORVV
MRGNSLVQATMIFFIGCLIICVQCGLDNNQMVVNQDGHAANTTIVNSNFVGENKILLKFCTRLLFCRLSDFFFDKKETSPRPLHQSMHGHFGTCYCCQNNVVQCYKRRSECQDNCPTCNPKCPPSSGSEG